MSLEDADSPDFNYDKGSGNGAITKVDEQKHNLALAYIIALVGIPCKPLIRKLGCLKEAGAALHSMFQSVSEAAIDASLSQLRAKSLKNSEKIYKIFKPHHEIS